jgi:hypothetical protein
MKGRGSTMLMMSLSSSVPAGGCAWIGSESVFVDHGPALEKVVDHAVDRLLVAGDDARGQHHRIALSPSRAYGCRRRRATARIGSTSAVSTRLFGRKFFISPIDHRPSGISM